MESTHGKVPSSFQGDKLPVNDVSWDDCQKFINSCEVKGLKVKLPHEDEWEYACRGGLGNKRHFYWGDTLNNDSLNGDKANCNGDYPFGTTSKGSFLDKTTVVGTYETKAKHPWGLCDMSGNVREWCENLSSKEGTDRVLRGGSYSDDAVLCRSASRSQATPDFVFGLNGFRVCLTAE